MATVEPNEAYRTLTARAEAASRLAVRRWSQMSSVDGWAQVLPAITALAATGRKSAAESAARSAADELASAVEVDAAAWSRSASDGRTLQGLLYSAVVRGRSLYGSGMTDGQIVEASGRWLSVLVRGQVVDAGRSASSVVTTATRDAGWIRVVRPPCCQRCAILAGKWFRWNEGFRRHPGCDCQHHPVKGSKVPAGFQQSIGADQIHDLTEAQRQAVTDGGDLNQVVNAYRAKHPGQRMGELMQTKGGRLTPEGIYARSKTRDEAITLLRANGYLL